MVMVEGVAAGLVTDPQFDIGGRHWGVCIKIQPQPGFTDFIRDIAEFQGEVDVTHSGGLFKGYTGMSMGYESDGGMEIFVVPDY